MDCINCGTHLSPADREYCPRCGFPILIQRKVMYLSRYYYNQGLEKAEIRDLSGAIGCLKQSLIFDKNNIDARNLLGLVYFETGEVVAALSEWVISKNLSPRQNLAEEYINKLQANSARLSAINETIRKYNHALELCREGHEDMASVQLRRILAQNSKLIKGYHLLALIHMKNHEWNKARRILRKAARIDKTNTTTLRFLKEVDERTGVTTRLEDKKRGLFRSSSIMDDIETENEGPTTSIPVRAVSKISIPAALVAGLAIGAAAFALLAVPSIRQNIYREANDQIVKYSESLASQSAELSRVQGEAASVGQTAEQNEREMESEQRKRESYEYLLQAYYSLNTGDPDTAAMTVQKVYISTLTDELLNIYNLICQRTGSSGLNDDGTPAETQSAENGYTGDTSGYDAGYDSGYDSYDYNSYDYNEYDYNYDYNYDYDYGY